MLYGVLLYPWLYNLLCEPSYKMICRFGVFSTTNAQSCWKLHCCVRNLQFLQKTTQILQFSLLTLKQSSIVQPHRSRKRADWPWNAGGLAALPAQTHAENFRFPEEFRTQAWWYAWSFLLALNSLQLRVKCVNWRSSMGWNSLRGLWLRDSPELCSDLALNKVRWIIHSSSDVRHKER